MQADYKIYWIEGEQKIQRGNPDGTNVETIVAGKGITDFVLDINNDKIYWVDYRTNKIRRANLNGTNAEDLITDLSSPRGMALDLGNGKIYWTEYGIA